MTDTRPLFAQRPRLSDDLSVLTEEAQSGDLLSALLRTSKLRGAGAAQLAPTAPFAIEFGETSAMLHMFERDGCELHIAGQREPRVVHAGEIVLLPRPQLHTILSGSAPAVRGLERRDLAAVDIGFGSARWLAGWFAVDAPSGGHMLAQLPAAIVLAGVAQQSLSWLDVSRRLLLEEIASPGQGSAVMISRILDLLFIQIVRAWARRSDADPSWMTGAMDPHIADVLTEIHARPDRQWTVAALANIAHLSRSAFAQRFAERIGHTPAAYIAQLRLDIAADRLQTTNDPINVIAGDVGYRSNAAFARAFSRRYGVAPKEWRAGTDAAIG